MSIRLRGLIWLAVGLFPMDMSVLTGLVNEEELLEERPEYV